MKNHVVWVNSPVAVTKQEHGLAPCGTPTARLAYDKMFELSRRSVRHFLAGEYEEHVLTQPAKDRNELFRRTYQYLRRLWRREPCNILFLDSDTLMTWHTEVFGKYQEFRMFNWTDPKSHPKFPNYYNCAVRYFPATMSRKIWDIGDYHYARWNYDIYAHEQEMYNHMFWAQNIPAHEAHEPDMNFQMPGASSPQQLQYWAEWNHCDFKQIKILHYHGTRGPEQAIQMATALSRSVLPPDEEAQAQEATRPGLRRLVTWCGYNAPGAIAQQDPVLSVLSQECQAQGISPVHLNQQAAITILQQVPTEWKFSSPLVIMPETELPAEWIKNQELTTRLQAWINTHYGLPLQVIQRCQ